ncbi:RDD family protein [Dongia sp.]|uniref:RDD family protein n=1 Tax=Dongia sp. TaxID=1977262 RepID=UPI0035AF5A47
MTDRKPPSIQLGSLESRRQPDFDAEFEPRPTAGIDLSDLRRYEGVLLSRCVAAMIDFVIVSVLSILLWLANCVATLGTLGLVSLPAFILAPVVIHILLCTYLLGGPTGASFGMRACGIRLVNLEGRRIDHVQAFLTTAMFFATVPIFVPVLLIGFFTERSRLLHDIVVGTVMVRNRPA